MVVREAYRDTVLSVDHWTTAYNEQTVAESFENEFSSTLADVLLDPNGTAFTPVITRQLRQETRKSLHERTETYQALDAEATQLETVLTELDAVLEHVRPVVEGEGTFAHRRLSLDSATPSGRLGATAAVSRQIIVAVCCNSGLKRGLAPADWLHIAAAIPLTSKEERPGR